MRTPLIAGFARRFGRCFGKEVGINRERSAGIHKGRSGGSHGLPLANCGRQSNVIVSRRIFGNARGQDSVYGRNHEEGQDGMR